MKRPGSPMQLALIIAVGALILPASMLLPLSLHASRHLPVQPCAASPWYADLLSPQLIGFTLLLLCGGAMYTWADAQLHRGLRDETWREDQLTPLRQLLNRPFTLITALIPLFAFITYAIVVRSSILASLYVFLLPLITVNKWKALLNRPAPKPLHDWHTFKPLHSNYWGSRQIEAAHGQNMKP